MTEYFLYLLYTAGDFVRQHRLHLNLIQSPSNNLADAHSQEEENSLEGALFSSTPTVSFQTSIKRNPEHLAFTCHTAQMFTVVSLSLLEDVAQVQVQPVFLDQSMAMRRPG